MCFRMNRISDVYFVGGFGTVQWLDVAEYMAATPDSIVMHQPLRVLQVGHSMQIMPRRHGNEVGKQSDWEDGTCRDIPCCPSLRCNAHPWKIHMLLP